MATLNGTGGNDLLSGTAGADTLHGLNGDDTLAGLAGNDQLDGGAGDDLLAGGAAEDWLHGGAGNDTLDGGPMTDRYGYTDENGASWAEAPAGVAVDLTGITGDGTRGSGTASDGEGGTDTLRNLQVFTGTDFADRFTASSALQMEFFHPGAGNDTVDGVVVTDTVDRAWRGVSYPDAGGPISVDLQAGTASGASIGSDTLLRINAVGSGLHADTLAGSDATHIWELFNGRGGNDVIDGRGGVDIVAYDNAEVSDGVIVDLALGTASDGLGGHDSLAGIEGVLGSFRADQFHGSNGIATEYFIGLEGDDTIDGRGGPDMVIYRFARGAVQVTLPGSGTSMASDGDGGTDVLRGIEGVFGSPFADRLTGSAAGENAETFEGFAGNDTIDGGDGFDEASYEHAFDRGAVVDLLIGRASEDGFGSADTLHHIEDLTGSRLFGDHLAGDHGPNRLRGLAGDDTLEGRAGDDGFWPSTGHDSIDGGSGLDTVYIAAPHEGFVLSQPDATSLRLVNATLDIDVTVRNVEGLIFQPYSVAPGNLLAGNVASQLADSLHDGAGNETVDALAGDDNLISNDGDDLLLGNAGDDWLQPETGIDSVDGGEGFDSLRLFGNRADFVVGSAAGYDLRLDRSGGQSVFLRNVERVLFLDGFVWMGALAGSPNVATPLADSLSGTNGADSVAGLAGNDSIAGLNGDDTLDGGAGDDTLDGATQVDTVSYSSSSGGQSVDLAAGTATGAGGSDLLLSIENIVGSPFDDVLTGDNGPNLIRAGAGNDTVHAGLGDDTVTPSGGDDSLDGGGGINTLNCEGAPEGVVVTLTAAGGANGMALGGSGGSDVLAAGTFQVVIGSGFADLLIGTSGGETLHGGDGHDTLRGLEGRDLLDGGAGNDLIVGGGAPGDGDDIETLIGGPGDDTIDGGNAFAAAFYRSSPAGVSADLGTGVASDAWGGTDSLAHVIAIIGSDFADVLTGDDAPLNAFAGYGGDDTIDGRGGIDWVFYDEASGPVTIDLAAGTASGGGMGGDTLLNIENAVGTIFADSIFGSETANELEGDDGNDSLVGGGGDDTLTGDTGNDTLDGGPGSDWASYEEARQAVSVNLAAGTSSGANDSDVLISIENLRGGRGNDNLTGDGQANRIEGMAGNNVIRGGAGDDTITGGPGRDDIRGDAGSDSIDGGVVTDRINYTNLNAISYSEDPGPVIVDLSGITGDGSSGSGSARDSWGDTDVLVNINFVFGSPYADSITGSSALVFEQFEGGAGNDTIDGGAIRDRIAGRDSNRATYQNAPAAVRVDLALGEASGGNGSDTLININQLRGSPDADTLLGSDRSDVTEQFQGSQGNDLIDGRGGNDRARYDQSPTGVVADLAAGTAQDGYGSIDTLVHIEGLLGSPFDDQLTGGLADNGTSSDGYGPADGLERFEGGAGNDTIDGGQGFDRAEYWNSTSGIVATLLDDHTGSAADGLGGTDALLNIEGLLGSAFADSLTGGDQPFEAFAGRAGDDTLDGGAGRDLADYRYDEQHGILLDLQAHSAIDGFGDHDLVLNMEIVFGSSFADTIHLLDTVDTQRGETVRGGGGNDTLDGGSGVDCAEWTGALAGFGVTRNPSTGVATVTDNDTSNGDAGTDTLTGIERLQFADRFVAFGTRAEELARVAFVLWTKDIVASTALFGRGFSFYDVGYDFATLCVTALQFWRDDNDAQLAQRLVTNSGSSQSVAQLLELAATHGGANTPPGRAAMVEAIARDTATTALIEASGIRSAGLVGDNEVAGFGALFALTSGG